MVERIVAGAQPAPATAPLKFVPNAARGAGLVYRSDANSQAWAQGLERPRLSRRRQQPRRQPVQYASAPRLTAPWRA